MNELAQHINQCKKPAGKQGKIIAEGMNERHYALTSWGMEQFSIEPDSIILDVGCGGGRTIHRLAAMTPRGKVFGIDYSPDCVIWSSDYNAKWIQAGRVEIQQASVSDLPFEKNFFDIVTAIETVYFWPNLIASFKEIKRSLKPDGKFIIVNEVYKNELFRERNDSYTAADSDMQIFAPEELQQLLKTAGFNNVTTAVVEANNWLCCIGENQAS